MFASMQAVFLLESVHLDHLYVSPVESSKELEELRGAFSRSLDYMKQDVEERQWTGVSLNFVSLVFVTWI